MKIKTFLPYHDDNGKLISPPRLVAKCDYCLSDMHKAGTVNAIGVYLCKQCGNPKFHSNKVDRAIHDKLINGVNYE